MNILENKQFMDSVKAVRDTYIALMVNTKTSQQKERDMWHTKICVLDDIVSSLKSAAEKDRIVPEEVTREIRANRLDRLKGLIA